MKKFKTDTYTQTKKSKCDWSAKKNHLMLKFMLDMGWKWRKFILLFHLNRVSGWKNT